MQEEKFVDCNTCPLRDLCQHSEPSASWRLRSADRKHFNYALHYGEAANEKHAGDILRVTTATSKCPLRGLLK